jgi:chromosome segregation ATPase
VSQLREEVANLTAANATLTTSLERKSLQFDGAKTESKELDATNKELVRTNADLKRQVDKWQSLDTKESEEMEKLRKQRIELEVQVKELETRLASAAQAAEMAANKNEKYKSRLEEYMVSVFCVPICCVCSFLVGRLQGVE